MNYEGRPVAAAISHQHRAPLLIEDLTNVEDKSNLTFPMTAEEDTRFEQMRKNKTATGESEGDHRSNRQTP